MFTKYLGRRYIGGSIDYVDYVDMDVFSVHELDDMLKEIGYINSELIYYHFLIPEIEIDYGLLPLGNDSDILLLSNHVANHKEIMVYTEHGTTRLHIYFMSLNKVVLEEINEPISPELNQKKFTSTEPASEELNKVQDVGPSEDFDPFFYMDHNDYQLMGDNDYQNMGDNEEIGDVISDETSTDGSISEDSEFLVDELNMVEDFKVNMKDFHSGVYSFPNLDNHPSFNAPDVTVDKDLEVIDTQLFESAGVEEDERKKLMRRLNNPTTCSSGVVHETAFHLGEIFKSSSEVTDYIKMHSIRTRRNIYSVKNDKKRIRAKCRGVVPEVTDKSQGSLTSTTTKLLDGVKKDASQYTCIFNGAEKTQVTGTMGEQFAVNWRDMNCSCRHWEITGIPCSHLVSSIWDKVGRPKKKRKRAQTEEPNNKGKSLTRKFLTVTCSKCKNKGHNSRSCKGQGGQNEVRNFFAGGKKLSKEKKQGDGKKENPKMKKAKTKLVLVCLYLLLVLCRDSRSLFMDLSKPGMTATTLRHMGSSNHAMKPQLLGHFQNLRPGLRAVHDVTITACLP
ncbi:unnamed protein product [Lactuca saligna]|uniref:SWIM-type domain-containing protein n=1 Tax=Lactuca saligna TaxID=75948 RepID=A0AA35YBZ8_LACSI|nr:unnamed protein product [Lactuca saligna]